MKPALSLNPVSIPVKALLLINGTSVADPDPGSGAFYPLDQG
jgi:hypothetical protein